MLTITLKLLLAHIIGDFVLQPAQWVRDKELKKIASPFLYLHVLLHGMLVWLMFQFDVQYLWVAVTISVSHGLIDACKLYAQRWHHRWVFFLDQLAHLIVIAWVVHDLTPNVWTWNLNLTNAHFLLITALLLVSVVSSIVMRVLMSRWALEEDTAEESLSNAGKYIGVCERLLVFAFIVLGQWQAIGFLIAAKSVFRFSDLSRAKDRKLTEYILIGTLLSFGLAIIIGLAYLHLLKHV
ncbi:DUF3307 domain-containing protein [Marinoscillum furvescens]|uniref:Uncharacterized protein DUF3307 n=1 Tax=Marinoscillum furvescens DSM 4134 TaxID=1122208 RepID=A0A3D9KXZ1_MARFU|nr:DUF3307 domain-containing protein [Marinoscillum furvescens]RED93832.1 uncharacterized protein DUF3307 [Marinoscillum furvescens DSM 4134]